MPGFSCNQDLNQDHLHLMHWNHLVFALAAWIVDDEDIVVLSLGGLLQGSSQGHFSNGELRKVRVATSGWPWKRWLGGSGK